MYSLKNGLRTFTAGLFVSMVYLISVNKILHRMKKLIIALCLFLASSSAWSQSSDKATDFSSIINTINAEKGITASQPNFAFDKTGKINKVNFVEKAGEEHNVFDFVADDGTRRSFDFHPEFPADFPDGIDEARVIHLVHQLIIYDESSDFSINFFVKMRKNTINHAPDVPTVSGIGLGASTSKRE